MRHGIDIMIHAMNTTPEPPTHLTMEELRDEEMQKLRQSEREAWNRVETELEVHKQLQEANERISKERDKLRGDFDNQAVVYSDRIAALEKCIAELEKDHKDAAGELGIDIKEIVPGSTVSKLVIANRLLINERQELIKRISTLERRAAYARHKASCPKTFHPPWTSKCNCGLDEVQPISGEPVTIPVKAQTAGHGNKTTPGESAPCINIPQESYSPAQSRGFIRQTVENCPRDHAAARHLHG